MLTRIVRLLTGTRARPKPGAQARPFLERLEDRTVPALFIAASVADLIAGINAANQTAESDTIALAPGATFSLTEVNNRTNGPTGTPVIAAGEDLTILGNGATIERNAVVGVPAFRLFDVAVGASLTLQNLTLQGGLASGYHQAASGGAVFNQGTLELAGVTVRNNVANGSDSFLSWAGVIPAGEAAGGGIYSRGALTMTGCTMQNNEAVGGCGANASLSIPTSPTTGPDFYFPSSPGGNAYGGALYVAGGTATIADCSFLGNAVQGGAGGNKAGKVIGSNGGSAFGGAICVAGGKVSLHNATITANSVIGGLAGSGAKKGQGIGGGIYIDAVALLSLDAFTKDHVLSNTASTNKSNIAGSYQLIP